jgi:hypothetical protein
MEDRPEPKFKKGQIVVLTSIKKEMPFRILFVEWSMGDWFYGFSPRNAVAESSIRKVTPEEVG